MTVPFNSAVINGGAYPVVWAEGLLEADALSAAGADRTAYASLDNAVAKSISVTEPVRLARASGGAEAYSTTVPFQPVRITPGSPLKAVGVAESSGVPYRARVVDGLPAIISAALSSPEPQRLVRMAPERRDSGTLNGEALNGQVSWAEGLVATAEALTHNRVISTRIVTAQAVAEAVAEAPSASAPVTRTMTPRRMRAVSLTFARSQDVFRIRVNQVPAGGPSIARAHSRATPNTILGFGWSYCDAESSLLPSSVYVARAAYPGKAEAEAETSTQSHLVRIIEFLFRAHAEMSASPDILRDSVRYAYAYGGCLGEALISRPIARRFPLFDAVPCEGVAVTGAVPRFEPRSRVTYQAVANTVLDDFRLDILHRVPVQMRFKGEAISVMTPTVLRDGLGEAVATADASITATRLVAQGASGQAVAAATAEADNVATLYMTGAAVGEPALSAAGAARQAFMSGVADGLGAAAIEASVYTIVSVESSEVSAGADSNARAIRVRLMLPEPMACHALIPPRSFKINAGDPASAQRTFAVPRTHRYLAIPGSSREYRIT